MLFYAEKCWQNILLSIHIISLFFSIGTVRESIVYIIVYIIVSTCVHHCFSAFGFVFSFYWNRLVWFHVAKQFFGTFFMGLLHQNGSRYGPRMTSELENTGTSQEGLKYHL